MNYGWGFLDNVVINNDAEYDSIVRKRAPLVAAIDFEKYTLLGQHAGGGGCIEPGCKITILRNDIEKKYVYNVRVLQYGSCQLAHLRYQWVLISKILPGYTVEFKKETEIIYIY